MADYRHVNHSQDRYLGSYITKFRELFKDDKLTVPQLHSVLQHFNIKKNENGTYNNSVIQALFKGYRVGWEQVNIHDLRKYYEEHLGTHIGNNNNIIDAQNYPTTNPYDIQKELTWDNTDEGDGLNWKDGNSMEAADAILQQRYQWESKQPLKKIRLSENQYNRLFEGVTYSKNNSDGINVKIDSNQDDYSNKEVDTRVFGSKENILHGDGTLPKRSKSLNQLVSDTSNRVEYYRNIIQYAQNGFKGAIQVSQVDMNKINDYAERNDVDGCINWATSAIDRANTTLNMTQSKVDRANNLNNGEKMGRYSVGKVVGTNVDVIALFTMNDFNFSDAIKHGKLRQNDLTDTALGINKDDRKYDVTLSKGGPKASKIKATYDNEIEADIKGNFSLNVNSNDHYKQSYGYNDESYHSVAQFLDKSIMYAKYALNQEKFIPDYIVAAPSSSQFNHYYCINLSRKLGCEYIQDFFKRNLLNIQYTQDIENEMIRDGISPMDRLEIETTIRQAVLSEVAFYAKQPIIKFVNNYVDLFSNISKENYSREKVDINTIIDILAKYIQTALFSTTNDETNGNIYKLILQKIYQNQINLGKHSKLNLNYLSSSILKLIQLKIGKKKLQELIEQVDIILKKYEQQLLNGRNFNILSSPFKITSVQKRFRKYLKNVYVIADKALNKEENLLTRYQNSKYLIFDEDVNSGATLKLVIEALQDKLNNSQKNIKCLVNAHSTSGW